MVVAIVIGACLLLILLGWIFKKVGSLKKDKVKVPKFKKPKEKKKKQTTEVKNVALTVVSPFMIRKEVLFLKYLNGILPRGFIAVPKVALNTLVVPDGNKNIFNLVADKSLDFVIFSEGDMQVRLVLDIYDKTYSDRSLSEQDPFLMEILSKLKIKVLQILVANDFNKEETKAQIYDALEINMEN